jgi:hypothetical protein
MFPGIAKFSVQLDVASQLRIEYAAHVCLHISIAGSANKPRFAVEATLVECSRKRSVDFENQNPEESRKLSKDTANPGENPEIEIVFGGFFDDRNRLHDE